MTGTVTCEANSRVLFGGMREVVNSVRRISSGPTSSRRTFAGEPCLPLFRSLPSTRKLSPAASVCGGGSSCFTFRFALFFATAPAGASIKPATIARTAAVPIVRLVPTSLSPFRVGLLPVDTR